MSEEANGLDLKRKNEEDVLHVFSLCPGCLLYKILKILSPCHHSLCENCLKRGNKEDVSNGDENHEHTEIICPTCSKKIEIPENGGTAAFPNSNLFIDLENYAEGRTHHSTALVADMNTDEVPASPMSPMTPIAPPKSPGSTAGDSGFSADEANDEAPKEEGVFNMLQRTLFGTKKNCQLHEKEELDSYCQTCEKIICSVCAKSEHADHSISNLKDLAKIRRKKVDKMMTDAVKPQLALAEKNVTKVDDEANNLPKELMETIAQTRSSFEELKKILEVKEEDCLTQLNQIYENKREKIEMAKEKSNNVLSALESGPEYLRKQLRKISNDRYGFMALSPQILAKAEEILVLAGKLNRDEATSPNIQFTMQEDFSRLREEINNLKQEI